MSNTMNEAGNEGGSSAVAVPAAMESFQIEHDRLSAYMRDVSTIGTPERRKVILTQRALNDFLYHGASLEAFGKRIAEIEAEAV